MTDDNQKPREYTWADTEKAEGLMPQYLEAITLREQVARLTAERDALRAALKRIAEMDEGDADLNEWGAAAVAHDTLDKIAARQKTAV